MFLACLLVLLSLISSSAIAQRVQFPMPAQPVQMTTPSPYAVPTTSAAPPPTFSSPVGPPPGASPYGVPPIAPGLPPAATSPYPATQFGAPAPAAVGPPPVFDPYATGATTVGPPPPTAPYTYSPPPPATSFPQQPGSMFPDGNPFQYQPSPYGTPATPGEGYWEKTQQFLQELSFEYTYLYGKHTDPNDLSINRAELSSTFAIPVWYTVETPLLVTPGFAFNWLEGPLSGPPMGGMAGGPDLPPQVYDAYLDFGWYPRVSETISGELGFRTGVWSDFSYWDMDSIRLLGRGLASVALTPQLDVLFGAVYLDRLDVKLLPAGGFYYRPTPDWDMYLVFPNPKVRKFVSAIGNSKWYWYLAGEYGGGSWTVTRETTRDRIDINDIRVSGGIEWETQTMIRGHVEAGFVWNRDVIFNSGDPPTFSPDNTIMFRSGVDF